MRWKMSPRSRAHHVEALRAMPPSIRRRFCVIWQRLGVLGGALPERWGGRRLGAFSWLGSEALVTRFAGRGSTAPVARFAGLGSACPSRRCLGPPARAVADQATWPKRSNDGQVSDPQPAARDLRRIARPRPALSTRPTARVRNLRPRRPRATRARNPPATGARERRGRLGSLRGRRKRQGPLGGALGEFRGEDSMCFYSSQIVPI